ncbi:uncharacterized protein [Oscarella lobularis]|uniref:uncharacterized protein isoform X2 n=1 Tax=Oscarella lobularis TaxID=121494 RepID=UPI0033134D06
MSCSFPLGKETTFSHEISPELRTEHESAVIGDELHLFGGRNEENSYFFPRNKIWTCDVREERKWIRRFAEGKNIPPPCVGAQCVVINGIMYSYGGMKKNASTLKTLLGHRSYLEEVFGLDPNEMKWILLETPTDSKKPWQRRSCCLWAIGERMIMFGGHSGKIPSDCLQSGARCIRYVNNEIYEFVFEEGGETGYWVDVELSGERPQPRACAATETIDEHRGLLHGGWDGEKSLNDAYVIDLREKNWIIIDFLPKPSARHNHRICRLSERRYEEQSRFLLIGGIIPRKSSDEAYVLDLDNETSKAISLTTKIPLINGHTLHCDKMLFGSAKIIVAGGEYRKGISSNILITTTLGDSHVYMKIGTRTLPPAKFIPTVREKKFVNTMKPEKEWDKLDKLAMKESILQDDRTQFHQVMERHRRQFEDERISRTQWEALYQSLEAERMRFKEQKSALENRCSSLQRDIEDLRTESAALQRAFEAEKEEMGQVSQTLLVQSEALQAEIAEMAQSHQAQMGTLQATLAESAAQRRALEAERDEIVQAHQTQMRSVEATLTETKESLDQFLNVLSIRASDVRLTNEKLGSGAYGDVIIGLWHKMPVAVKRFHALITTPRTIPKFKSEVLTASRLHHPNIIRVCGAVMEDGTPFQIVSELLEGSVSEVIDAAHSSPCYLSQYEQLSIVVQMTSAIAYLHGLHPRPYVHADIRPTNVLVTRDMKVKVADSGAAHLVESSISAGPLSPQYLAPERMPPTSARSSLPSDVYSLGVTLIEIFTGVGPIREQRNGQLMLLRNRRRLHVICSRMIFGERERPRSAECMDVMIREMEELAENGFPAIKRMVKSQFEGEGDSRRHKVVLSDSYHS